MKIRIEDTALRALQGICDLQHPERYERRALKNLAIALATIPGQGDIVSLAVQYATPSMPHYDLPFAPVDQAQAWSNAIHDSREHIEDYEEIKSILLPRAQVEIISPDGFHALVDRSQRRYHSAGRRIGRWIQSNNPRQTRERASRWLESVVESGQTATAFHDPDHEAISLLRFGCIPGADQPSSRRIS